MYTHVYTLTHTHSLTHSHTCIHTHTHTHTLTLTHSHTHAYILTHRLSVDRYGCVVFNHERADSWNINHHLQSLQKHEGLTPRDIYWRLWGLINWLKCEKCGCYFQCSELPLCVHHPQPVMVKPSYSGEHLSSPLYSCCKRPVLGFSTLPHVQVYTI